MKRLSKEERKRKKYHLWPKRGEFEDALNCEEEGEEEVEVAAEENIQQLLIFFIDVHQTNDKRSDIST